MKTSFPLICFAHLEHWVGRDSQAENTTYKYRVPAVYVLAWDLLYRRIHT